MPEKKEKTSKAEQSKTLVKGVIETAKKMGLNVFIVCGATFGTHHNGDLLMGDEEAAKKMWQKMHQS